MFPFQHIDSDGYDRAQGDFSRLLCGNADYIDVSDRTVRFRPDAVASLRNQFLSTASAIDIFTRTKATKDIIDALSAAPIIETRGSGSYAEKILMVWPRSGNVVGSYPKWLALRESFRRSGVDVVSGETEVSKRSLWIRDTSFVLGDTAYIPDESARLDWVDWSGDIATKIKDAVTTRINECRAILEKHGLKIVRVDGAYFEGGNLIVDPVSKKIFWGDQNEGGCQPHRERLCAAIDQAQGWKYEVIPVKTDANHYHLDLGMSSMLPKGEFLVADCLGWDANSKRSDGYEKIREHLPKERIVPISYFDSAKDFAANLDVVGDTLFMTGCSLELQKKLVAHGYTVNVPSEENIPPKSEFRDRACYRRIGSPSGGGGAHCLTQSFHL